MTLASKAASVVFRGVSKAFGQVVAVNDVSFEVQPGHLITLLGPSGCGKTTTLRLIAGLELPTAGQILIGERDVTTLPATARDVSMVFQSYALFPHMTVAENVAYGLVVSGMRKAEAAAKGEEGLALVGLEGYGSRLPSELSGGQQQRVAVARALVLEPEVILFDEPLSNLDAKLRRQVREEIRELQQRLGLTAIYVTHDQGEALAVSDRIIVMNRAVIAQEATPRELYEQPLDRFVADFIGDANLVAAEITAVDGALAWVQIGPLERQLPRHGLDPGPAHVALRPERIELGTEPYPDTIGGEVLKATYLGSHLEYTVETALGTLFVIDHDVARALPPKTQVAVRLDAAGLEVGLDGVPRIGGGCGGLIPQRHQRRIVTSGLFVHDLGHQRPPRSHRRYFYPRGAARVGIEQRRRVSALTRDPPLRAVPVTAGVAGCSQLFQALAQDRSLPGSHPLDLAEQAFDVGLAIGRVERGQAFEFSRVHGHSLAGRCKTAARCCHQPPETPPALTWRGPRRRDPRPRPGPCARVTTRPRRRHPPPRAGLREL